MTPDGSFVIDPHATPVTEMDLANAKLWPDVLQETSESIAETLKQAKTAYSGFFF